jgi:hypothetical protein
VGDLARLVLVFFLTAAAFGLPLQAAVDLLPPGNPALALVGLLVASGAATWLTGGTFGPEASLFALLLVSTITMAALSPARRTGRFDIRRPPAAVDPA